MKNAPVFCEESDPILCIPDDYVIENQVSYRGLRTGTQFNGRVIASDDTVFYYDVLGWSGSSGFWTDGIVTQLEIAIADENIGGRNRINAISVRRIPVTDHRDSVYPGKITFPQLKVPVG
jgi:hypothetical protein